jgi:hypothetical protein
MRSFIQDYKYGISKQTVILSHIKKFFNDDTIKELESKFSKHDYIGTGKTFELKSRTNTSYLYPDTLLPADKILDTNDKQIFLFNFTDKLAYIEYDKTLFNKFKCVPFRRHQRSDFNDKEKLYYHIPISQLKTICLY